MLQHNKPNAARWRFNPNLERNFGGALLYLCSLYEVMSGKMGYFTYVAPM